MKKGAVHLQQFWKDYLVGKDGDIGIELMTSIEPFQELMKKQVEQLRLSDGDIVIDLGSGTGSFPRFIATNDCVPVGLRIVEIDFVTEGFSRARQKLEGVGDEPLFGTEFVESNLDLSPESPGVPILECSVNAVIASLMLSYVKHPERLLSEIHRILKPGGRVVVSSLRRDADMSKLYMDGIEELRSGLARQEFGMSGERNIEMAARQYLNQASRLLELEEAGEFRFWDSDELEDLIRSVGFKRTVSRYSLGKPPQAVVVSGVRL
jgi:ubiquinone/menaquinone biosynthesis C-methylase UbiE